MIFLGDVQAEFARRKGSRDKLPRARRTQYGPPGQTGEKLSTGWKSAARAGAISAGLTSAVSLGLGNSVPQSLKHGALIGAGAAGLVGGVRTLGWLTGPRSPIAAIRRKRQKDAYEIADAKARIRAMRKQK